MEIKDFKKLLEGLSEEAIEFDDPHVALRCQENNITKEKIIKILLYETYMKPINYQIL